MSPEQLWSERYAQRFAEERAKEDGRRDRAWLNIPSTVCREEIRLMTPMDLLTLSGVENAFVVGTQPEPGDVAAFLWALHVNNSGTRSLANRARRWLMVNRVASLSFEYCIREIMDYLDEVMQDAPTGGGGGGERRPLGVSFLAPLLRRVSIEVAPIDPTNGKPMAQTPIPRIWQWLKAADAAKRGSDFIDHNPSDRLTGEFLSELNQLNQNPAASPAA